VDLQLDQSDLCEGSNGQYRICRSILELDRLINIPVLKGHCQTAMTCALKNLKGCIPDSEKQRYHREGLFQAIADLNEILRSDLILVDALGVGSSALSADTLHALNKGEGLDNLQQSK
jgi:uncharacterized protein (DUF362 family)